MPRFYHSGESSPDNVFGRDKSLAAIIDLELGLSLNARGAPECETDAPEELPSAWHRAEKLVKSEKRSIAGVKAFPPLVAFLSLDAQGRDRPRFESHQADRLAGLFTITVGAIVQTRQCCVDLGN
jgi:hypothetical protein